MPTYCIEYAKSNRSSCKVCKAKIEMDALRVGTISPGPGDYDLTSWRHMTCHKITSALSGTSVLTGFDALKEADKKKVEEWLAGSDKAATQSKKRSADELGEVSKLEPKKMKAKDLDSALKAAGVTVAGKKKEKEAAMEEVVERAQVEERYSKLTLPQLKEMAGSNKQLKGGTKGELLDRCVDGKMYGALPRCPECGGGILKVFYADGKKYGHDGQGNFSCPGFFDDDQWKRCKYVATSAERLPWQELEN